LHLTQFCGESNDLILFANFTLLSTIFKHVIVGLDDFSTNLQCISLVRVSAKVPVAKDVDLGLETFYFNSERCIEVVHDILGFMIYSWTFLFDGDSHGLYSRMPFDNVKGMIN
jgi:hypothetical protein